MTIYVLIAVFNMTTGTSVVSQEFTSHRLCNVAKNDLQQHFKQDKIIYAQCYKVGEYRR